MEKLRINTDINWRCFEDGEPDYGDLILLDYPPEANIKLKITVWDKNTDWLYGCRYALIKRIKPPILTDNNTDSFLINEYLPKYLEEFKARVPEGTDYEAEFSNMVQRIVVEILKSRDNK